MLKGNCEQKIIIVLVSHFSSFTVKVPATIANMGPGFDSFGMAITLYNEFTWSISGQDVIFFPALESENTASIRREGSDNILFKAMDAVFQAAGQKRPACEIRESIAVPVARGLGSSSTAAAAGLVAANKILGDPFSRLELLRFAIALEGHPDNVTPALMGGVTFYDEKPYQLPWPAHWRVMTLSPNYPVMTAAARRMLPETVPMQDAVYNLRKTALLTYALLKSDEAAFRASLGDRLHQPHRRSLIAELPLVEPAALQAGAFGVIISGSGSTIAVLYPLTQQAEIHQAIQTLMNEHAFSFIVHDETVDTQGARLI